MPQIKAPVNYINGQTIDADAFNNHVNGAILDNGAITEQISLTAGTLPATSKFLTYNVALNQLQAIVATDIVQSGLPIKAGTITGNTGADLAIVPSSGQKASVSGNLAVTGTLEITGNTQVSTVTTTTERFGIGNIKAFTIPSGTTANRPTTPGVGDVRYNTTLQSFEVYTGSAWTIQQSFPYKQYTRNYIFPGLSSWTLPPYQWETGSSISIPAGETWNYTWEFIIPNGNVGGNTRPEKVGDFVVYLDTTEMKRIPLMINAYSGPISCVCSQSFTSIDTTTPKKVRVRIEQGTGSARVGLVSFEGVISLTVRPTADSTFITNNL